VSDKPRRPTVKPSLNEDEKRHSLFTGLSIRSLIQLSKYLDKSSTIHTQRLYPPNATNAKHYVISAMLDEVQKSTLSLVQTADFIDESNKAETTSSQDNQNQLSEMKEVLPGFEGNIYQSKIDELVLWERKLTEQLVDLVGFRRIKLDIYYRHYISLRELDKLKKLKSDFYEYYGADNKNIQYQIDQLKADIDILVSKLEKEKCFYLENPSATNRDRFKLATFKKRLDINLPRMTANEKIMVGQSYAHYSEQSSSLHPGTAKFREDEQNMNEVDDHFMRVALLGSSVIFAAKDCLNIHNITGDLANFHRAMKENEHPEKQLKKSTKPNIQKGDFVIAYSDLAQVTKVINSKFGYRSFRVKYLMQAPIPELGNEEEMPAIYVSLYQKRSTIALQIIQHLRSSGSENINIRQVNKSITHTLLELWNEAGGKERANGDTEGADVKLRDYSTRIKEEAAGRRTRATESYLDK